MRTKSTIVIVADDENIFFYKLEDSDKGLEKLEKEYHQKISDERNSIVDRPEVRQMRKDNEDMHEEAQIPQDVKQKEMRINFLRKGANFLHNIVYQDKYEQIIIIAPSAVLAEIKKSMNEFIKSKIAAEIDKDLTNSSKEEIQEHLHGVSA